MGFSVRSFAKSAHMASGLLPMVLNGKRALSSKAFGKIIPLLGLKPDEKNYLVSLREVDEAGSVVDRHEALQRIQKSKQYRGANPKEVEVCQYLSHWYLVAIREMVALKDFKEEPKWIQARLRYSVSIKEVERALHFLVESGFLYRDEEGQLQQANKNIECLGQVYSLSLAQFHKQMMMLASNSLDRTPKEARNITGHTFAVPKSRWKEVVLLLEETLKKVSQMEGKENNEEVYHVILGAFPLTTG